MLKHSTDGMALKVTSYMLLDVSSPWAAAISRTVVCLDDL